MRGRNLHKVKVIMSRMIFASKIGKMRMEAGGRLAERECSMRNEGWVIAVSPFPLTEQYIAIED